MGPPAGAPVAIVTGGGRGIGQAIGRALAQDGYRVVLVDLNGRAAEDAAQDLRANGAVDAVGYQADVREYARAQEVVADVLGRFGRVDVLVNNAGIASPTPFLELTEADWDLVVGVHLKGSFNWSH